MKTIELTMQLYQRFGQAFVDLFLLERRFKRLSLADDHSEIIALLEQFRALALTGTPSSSLQCAAGT